MMSNLVNHLANPTDLYRLSRLIWRMAAPVMENGSSCHHVARLVQPLFAFSLLSWALEPRLEHKVSCTIRVTLVERIDFGITDDTCQRSKWRFWKPVVCVTSCAIIRRMRVTIDLVREFQHSTDGRLFVMIRQGSRSWWPVPLKRCRRRTFFTTRQCKVGMIFLRKMPEYINGCQESKINDIKTHLIAGSYQILHNALCWPRQEVADGSQIVKAGIPCR